MAGRAWHRDQDLRLRKKNRCISCFDVCYKCPCVATSVQKMRETVEAQTLKKIGFSPVVFSTCSAALFPAFFDVPQRALQGQYSIHLPRPQDFRLSDMSSCFDAVDERNFLAWLPISGPGILGNWDCCV